MVIVLALCSALSYGLSDFVGGSLARRTSAWSVAVVGQTSSMLCVGVLALLGSGHPTAADFGWSVVAGVGGGLGAAFLYQGLSSGRMAVVAPVSAVGAAVVPVLAGVGTGERPALLTWVGIVAAFPGIWLVSSMPSAAGGRRSIAAGVLEGALAGVGFGMLFAALGQVPAGAGWWPLTLAQGVSVVSVVCLALALRVAWLPRDRPVRWAVCMGPLGAAATGAFVLATQHGFLTVAGVLASLYPASTVLLAAVVLHERVHRSQGIGLVFCAVAVALVAAG